MEKIQSPSDKGRINKKICVAFKVTLIEVFVERKVDCFFRVCTSVKRKLLSAGTLAKTHTKRVIPS
jgi:hypothetical protein